MFILSTAAELWRSALNLDQETPLGNLRRMNSKVLHHPRRRRLHISSGLPAILALLATALPMGCAATGPSDSAAVTVTVADRGRTVRLAPGERMLVELLGNPSTGRVWELRSLPDAAVLVPDGTRWVAMKDDPAQSDLARTQQLRFVAQGAGRALLVFEYVQPSAPSEGSSSFTVAVEVMAK